jgi:hypothetical protein
MQTETITNKNINDIDWSAKDRQDMLRSIPKMKSVKQGQLFTGLAATDVWMKDVSIMDSRSVKAQLAGHGDARTFWWSLNYFVHKLFVPKATLEEIMVSFHRKHHFLTIKRIQVNLLLTGKSKASIGRRFFSSIFAILRG